MGVRAPSSPPYSYSTRSPLAVSKGEKVPHRLYGERQPTLFHMGKGPGGVGELEQSTPACGGGPPIRISMKTPNISESLSPGSALWWN